MPSTLAEKIIARAAGVQTVVPGDVVTVSVDLAMIHDSGGPRRVAPVLSQWGVGLWDPTKVVLIADHYVPGDTQEGAQILEMTRAWAIKEQVTFHDGLGICHVVLPEKGHLRPGQLVVGGDSHSPTGGAFGAYMFGVGATDMAGVLATGETWLTVPATIAIRWDNALEYGVLAKDMMLAMCARLGMDGGQYQAVEYSGSTIAALSMPERMTMSNMAAELGAQAGLIAPDATTIDYLRRVGADPGDWQSLRTDPDAPVLNNHAFDAASLAPQVAAPHSPANADSAQAARGTAITMAYIGACTGAKYEDLANAATVLRGRRLAKGVELVVAPASKADQERATQDGIMAVYEDLGARILPNACGICAGYGSDRLSADTVCISTTARNFKGRMGDPEAQVWLASPFTVAASAVTGSISDPRDLLASRVSP